MSQAQSAGAQSSPLLVRRGLESVGYLADDGLATVVFLSLVLRRPLFLEGEPGAGKTELARALSVLTGGELVRLQCYEGIDVAQAVYEWDYARQLLHLRAAEVLHTTAGEAIEDELFDERFLVRRPLLRALSGSAQEPRPVLLIDEIDRADDEFEAYLLEMLADYAVTVPELGTITATQPPVVVLTSNRTRDVHDALKRRSLYHWVEHPDFAREVAILALKVPEAAPGLSRQVTAVVQELRGLSLYKPPGVAETIDWAEALTALGRSTLEQESMRSTLGIVLKYREDQQRVSELVPELLERASST